MGNRKQNAENAEADGIVAARTRAPKAVELAQQLYALAAEVQGAAAEQVEAIGWAVDDLANRGLELTDEQARDASLLCQQATGGPW